MKYHHTFFSEKRSLHCHEVVGDCVKKIVDGCESWHEALGVVATIIVSLATNSKGFHPDRAINVTQAALEIIRQAISGQGHVVIAEPEELAAAIDILQGKGKPA